MQLKQFDHQTNWNMVLLIDSSSSVKDRLALGCSLSQLGFWPDPFRMWGITCRFLLIRKIAPLFALLPQFGTEKMLSTHLFSSTPFSSPSFVLMIMSSPLSYKNCSVASSLGRWHLQPRPSCPPDSDHSKSITIWLSLTRTGLSMSLISIRLSTLPTPPLRHRNLSSMAAARGRSSNMLLIAWNTDWESAIFYPSRTEHSSPSPQTLLTARSSCLPLSRWMCSGYLILRAMSRQMVSRELKPLSTQLPRKMYSKVSISLSLGQSKFSKMRRSYTCLPQRPPKILTGERTPMSEDSPAKILLVSWHSRYILSFFRGKRLLELNLEVLVGISIMSTLSVSSHRLWSQALIPSSGWLLSFLLSSIRLPTGTFSKCRPPLSPLATTTWLLSLVFLDELMIRLGVRSLSCSLLRSSALLILELPAIFLYDSPISLRPIFTLLFRSFNLDATCSCNLDATCSCPLLTSFSTKGCWGLLDRKAVRSSENIVSRGWEMYSGSNPPWTRSLEFPCITIEWRYLLNELTLCHSAVSVSQASMQLIFYSGSLALPPMMMSLLPMKQTRCWQRPMGVQLSVRGGVAQSQVPLRCLTSPQISFKAETESSLWDPLWSFFVSRRPPQTTIMPVALPSSQRAAEWQTLGQGTRLLSNSYLAQVKGPFWKLSSQTSFSTRLPELPPKMIRQGLLKTIVCPYRCPGVLFLGATSMIFQLGSRRKSSRQSSSFSSPCGPDAAPPQTTICMSPTMVALWAARSEGTKALMKLIFFQTLVWKSQRKVSLVMMNLPE